MISPAAWPRGNPPTPNASATSDVAAPRQPGTRGGVFHQKISNGERVLLALLCHRRLCTLDVLAGALGGVSRSAVGNVIRQTLPLLQHEDNIPGPAPARYRTAADLLAAGATNDTTT
jgi:hypothetical protein